MTQVSKYAAKLKNLPAKERTAILDEVLVRYMDGEKVANFAHEYGCTHPPIYHALLEEREQEWKDAQIARAVHRLESATAELETAADGLTVTRARETIRAAQWELERLLRRLYGQDQPSTGGSVAIQINIGAAQPASVTVHPLPEQD